jgi:hypothetical protein
MRGWKSVFEPRGGAVPAAREVAAASDSDDDDVGDKRLGATCEITLSAEDLRLIAE